MKALIKLIILPLLLTNSQHILLNAQNPFPEHTNCERQKKEAALWYFGVFAGMDFTSGEAIATSSQPDVFQTPISPAVMSDSSGNLLFMTTGKQVYNKYFNLMVDGLYGHYSCTQPAIIVPRPQDPDRYYIFTVDSYRDINGDKGLNYTEIDMSLNYGQGNVVSVNNNLVAEGMDGRLTGIKHANDRDFWVISHRWESNEFLAFRVTPSGVDPAPVSSQAGPQHGGDNNLLGYMKASPDGSRLGVVLYASQTLTFYSFDTETGKVSDPAQSPSAYKGAYGLEFSPDNTKAYMTTLDYANTIPSFQSELYQFDLNSSDIFGTATLLHTSTDAYRYAGLQLGIDGRIYMAKSINAAAHSDYIGVIYNPNRAGEACNFNRLDGDPDTEFYLEGKESFWGLPNLVQSFVDWPHFTFDSVCIGDLTSFNITNKANIEDASWEFNDPDGSSNTANFLQPTHVFSEVGQYLVSVTETYEGIDYTYTEPLKVYDLPEVDFGVDTIYIFEGDAARLSVGEWAAYLWSTGATTSEILVYDPGLYWVEVMNGQCCRNADTVVVVQYELHIPNAFRPGSNINYEFKPIVPFNAVQDYRFQIYDRWGQVVFESRDLGTGWDGSIRNQPAPMGVYAWRIDYKTASEEGTRPVEMAGTVMLLR